VNSLPKTVTQIAAATLLRRGCDLNPGPSAPESSTLTTRLPSYPDSDCGGGNKDTITQSLMSLGVSLSQHAVVFTKTTQCMKRSNIMKYYAKLY